MAHFYGSMQGARGETTRTGTAASGLWGHLRGWHVGAKVSLHCQDGEDEVSVGATAGSSGYDARHIGTIRNGADGLELIPSAWTIAQVQRHLTGSAANDDYSVKV
jgi:hypothetical protein